MPPRPRMRHPATLLNAASVLCSWILLIIPLLLCARPTTAAAAAAAAAFGARPTTTTAAFGLGGDATALRNLGVSDADIRSLFEADINDDDEASAAAELSDELSAALALSLEEESGDNEDDDGADYKSKDDWWKNPLGQFDGDGGGKKKGGGAGTTKDAEVLANQLEITSAGQDEDEEAEESEDSASSSLASRPNSPTTTISSIASVPSLVLSQVGRAIFTKSPQQSVLVTTIVAAGFARFGWHHLQTAWEGLRERRSGAWGGGRYGRPTTTRSTSAGTADADWEGQSFEDTGLGALYRRVRHTKKKGKTSDELEDEIRSLIERAVSAESQRDHLEREFERSSQQLQDMRHQIKALLRTNADLKSHLRQIEELSDGMQRVFEGMERLSESLEGLSSKTSGHRFYGA